MSEVTVLERPALVDKFIATSFKLCKAKNSRWLRDGTGADTGVPAQWKNTSNILILSIKSRLFLGKGKGYMPTMYIPNAPTHYVNDYWVERDGTPVFDKLTAEQAKERGLEFRQGLLALYGENDSNGQRNLRTQEQISKGKNICFSNGELHLMKFGDDPVLLKFVNEHEQNKFAPNAADNPDRNRVTLFMFEPLIPEKKALKGKVVANFDVKRDATNFVDKLRTKNKDGYLYNESKLDAILSILQEGIHLQAGEVNQKFEIIIKCADLDPAEFLKAINDTMEQYRIEVGKAESLNVIEYAPKEIKITIDGKKKTFLAFNDGEKKDEMLNGLVLYLIGDKTGQEDFRELKRQTEMAKISALKK